MPDKLILAGKEHNIRKASPRDMAQSEREARKSAKDKGEVNFLACIGLARSVVTPPLSDAEFENLTLKEVRDILLKAIPRAESALQPLLEYDDWTVLEMKSMFCSFGG